MAPASGKITIVSLDQMDEAILIHFSDGVSVLYQAQFLYDVQNDDGNVPISNKPDEEAPSE
jgi:hypothetical protein